MRLSAREDVDIVAEAKNGREALKLIEELGPDLVFLDIQMPGMDGLEAVAYAYEALTNLLIGLGAVAVGGEATQLGVSAALVLAAGVVGTGWGLVEAIDAREQADDACLHDAVAYRAGCLIAGAADHRCTSFQARGRRRFRGDHAGRPTSQGDRSTPSVIKPQHQRHHSAIE